MIKIGLRRNLLYPLMLIIFTTIRKIDTIIMNRMIGFDGSLFLTLFMFLSEFIIGLIIFLKHTNILNREKRRNPTFMGIKLIQRSSEIPRPDKNIKIFMLIFMATFFDFNIFLIETYYLPKQYKYISQSLNIRLRSILTISSALCCYFLLRIPIFKHQKFSLVIIFICLIIVIFSEFVFEQDHIMMSIFSLILNCFVYFLNSCLEVTEKYLLEHNFINPFKMIMLEGIIGFIFTCLFSIIGEPFAEIIQVYENNVISDFIILIALLFLYLISSGGRNIYRVITNKIYSPMTRTLTDCILDPLLIIYYFIYENDFIYNKEQNYYYFFINLFTSIIIVICSCIYNEIFVIFYCKLEENTHFQISRRATIPQRLKESTEYEEHDSSDDNSDSHNQSMSSYDNNEEQN